MFTEKFRAASLDDQPALVEQERHRRVTTSPDEYVPVPVVIPRMSTAVEGEVAAYDLFWLIGLPGPIEHPQQPGRMAREAINFQCAREATAEHLAYLFNWAKVSYEYTQAEQARYDRPETVYYDPQVEAESLKAEAEALREQAEDLRAHTEALAEVTK
jgi:cell division protein FtsB